MVIPHVETQLGKQAYALLIELINQLDAKHRQGVSRRVFTVRR